MQTTTLVSLAGLLLVAVACSSSGSSPSGATGCAALATCCADMTGVSAQVCGMVASGGSTTTCDTELSAYQSSGQCLSATQNTCQMLATCCAGAPAADQQSCLLVVHSGVAASCAEGLATYQPLCASGTGTGTGAGCVTLATCCSQMTGTSATACTQVAAAGVSSTCAAELSAFESTGACGGGSGPGTGTGIGSGAACTDLSTCCSKLSGQDKQGCNEVVSSGVASTCSSELAAFQSSGLCTQSGSGTGSGFDGGPGFDSGPDLDSGPGFETGTPDSAPALPPLQCTVPATSPSGGSCVTVVATNDAGTGAQCNPVTNAGCAAGSACDVAGVAGGGTTGFICYPPPPANTALACATCDDSTIACAPGGTCVALTSTCGKYCCTDADCGAGTCTTIGNGMSLFAPIAPNLGVCTM